MGHKHTALLFSDIKTQLQKKPKALGKIFLPDKESINYPSLQICNQAVKDSESIQSLEQNNM